MLHFTTKLKKPTLFYPLMIVFIEVILFVANYKPGTFLIGWDNIMPEFDIKANFIRSIFSIWQEYRGLGVLDGLSHAANLTHTVYIFLLSLFLPESILRYVFIHLTHLVGGLGLFFLLKKLTKNPKAAFIGGLFYMFNLAIVQMYFAPLEVFALHFAALPVLSLLLTNALEKTTKRNLFALFLGSFLLSQQGFVPTVFIAYSILAGFMLLLFLLKGRRIKEFLLIVFVLIAANAFWAVPYSYSALHTGKYITESRINEFSSEEIFYRNKTFGDIGNVATLKGFMIDSIELNPVTFNDSYFMGIWRDLASNLLYKILYGGLFVLILLGAFVTLFKRRLKYLPYFLAGLVAFIFLANDTPGFSELNGFIRNTFPLLGEAFRFPFTKFVTLFAFSLSVLLAVGISFLLERFKNYQRYVFPVLLVILLIICFPAFLGYFTSPFLKQKLPDDYQALFKEMQSLPPDQRVALFPVQTFWNWQYRSWGQRGSGFIWHGLPQPILERAFDPWSPYDEQFYNEIAYAVNTEDEILFENVVKKYDIRYIVLDQYLLNTLSKKSINYDSLRDFLANSAFIKEKDKLGKVIIYETKVGTNFVYDINAKSTRAVFPNYSFEKEDSIYGLTDNYVTNTNHPSVINLFPSLYSEKTQEDLEYSVKNLPNEYVLTPKKALLYNLDKYTLKVPSLFQTEFLVPIKVDFQNGELRLTPSYPKIEVNGSELAINEDPLILKPQKVLDPVTVTFVDIKHSLKLKDKNRNSYLLNPALNSIKITDKNGANEIFYLDTGSLDKKDFYVTIPKTDNNSITLTFPKAKTSLSSQNILASGKYDLKKAYTGPFTKPYSDSGSQKGLGYVDLFAKDGGSELAFYLPNLYHQGSYIVLAENNYNSGLPIRFYVDNDTEQRAEVEAVLSKKIKDTALIIPKANNYFKGYGIHFIVRSVGKEQADSTISNIEVYPFPASFVRSLQFIDDKTYQNPTNINPKENVSFTKINKTLYKAEARANTYLVLSQAYDAGWKAYSLPNGNAFKNFFPFIFGKNINEHTLVDNWANGWKINGAGQVVIIYLPQYLEYLGFLVTFLSFIILLTMTIKRRKKKYLYEA